MPVSLVRYEPTGATSATLFDATGRPIEGEFVYTKDEPGESIRTLVGGDLTRPVQHRLAVSSVSDVFRGTGVAPISGQRTDGVSILVQTTEVMKVYDPINGDVTPYYLPASCHMVLKFPLDGHINAIVVGGLVRNMLGSIVLSDDMEYPDALAPLLIGAVRLREPDPAT